MTLDPQKCLQLYRDNPNFTLTDVAKALAEDGMVNPQTQRPYTKQSISNALNSTPEGKALIDQRRDQRRSTAGVVTRFLSSFEE